MIFNINNNVLFNEEEGTLSQIENESTQVTLLKPASRLLSLFIQHNNVLLLRERLLNEVWVEHGLKASNNNLNNYVSGLRKSLAQFGEEELIITYPRQGFKFSARVINLQAEEEETAKNEKGILKAQLKEKKHHPGVWRALQRLILTLAACLVPFAAVVLYQNSNRINVYPLGSYKQCQIYSMKLNSVSLAALKHLIHHSGLSCEKRADVYYYDNIRNEGAEGSKEQLTFCPREINGPCINKYIDTNND
ncbi:winged helix-turn-helix domain-containing protein [Serratia marcescens]|uniref:winged helix-turn-helix domain-containing protein n=1 Tax=Serratia nevei TaxID=2703794 RepID=UPI0018D2D226|nr:winged helix-turn-helix domain-containing protein [Serratia marcescens]MBH2844202.1 winged helix-turn-helix domain-containing protein [Serratia marcescens]MBH2863984.1 winged helix-turn-helix domain-containing protein [Serratia marcescens]MBN5378631.1 winged helix-turn-helix domain-containing protein [Serratia marcescens]